MELQKMEILKKSTSKLYLRTELAQIVLPNIGFQSP